MTKSTKILFFAIAFSEKSIKEIIYLLYNDNKLLTAYL